MVRSGAINMIQAGSENFSAVLRAAALVLTGAILWVSVAAAATSPDLWSRWQTHSQDSTFSSHTLML